MDISIWKHLNEFEYYKANIAMNDILGDQFVSRI